MIMAEFSIVPLGEGVSISRFVAKAVEVVADSGLEYRLTPMGTVVEGEWDDVFGVIKNAFDAVHDDSLRTTCTIKIDCRRGEGFRMERKIASVEDKLDRPLNK